MNVQSILLRRKNKVLLPAGTKTAHKFTLNVPAVSTFNLNLQSLGYTLSPTLFRALTNLNGVTAFKIFDDILAVLKEQKGVRNYTPMYPNFPQQVIEADAAELYFNAIIHYFSFRLVDATGDPDMIWLPKYAKDKRAPLDERVNLRVIEVATANEADEIANNLAKSNTSLSASDKEDLKALITAGYGNVEESLALISNKENLAFVGSLLVNGVIDLTPYFKTATDVLRLATAMSGGDVSLTDKSKFKAFKRSERRYILGLLEPIKNKAEDMARWPSRWIRLGERLHPGEFQKKFPTSFYAFKDLRNNKTIETYRSQVEASVRAGETIKSITLLQQRPGEFARRLDHVLRNAAARTQTRVAESFLDVASDVSTPVLLQVMTHFSNRAEGYVLRVVFPKGNVAHCTALENDLPTLRPSICLLVVDGIKRVLAERFSALPKLGKVYIDPALRECLVPFSQRSASKSLRTLVRGSKLAFGNDKDTLRFFIWWHDMKEDKADTYWGNRVDLDLSASSYDENWNALGAVTFYNLREGYAVHSGDITSAPNGAAEFIDVDIPKAIKQRVRYVVMTVHGYTEQNFCDLPECFAGFMLREKAQSGEVFDPRTIEDKADLSMAARSGVPMIIDLVGRKVIWADAAMNSRRDYGWGGNTVASTRGTIELLGRAFTNIKKPNLYDLFALHAAGRGKLVTDETKADVVFSVKAGTPFELDKIASEFMTDEVVKPKAKSKAKSA